MFMNIEELKSVDLNSLNELNGLLTQLSDDAQTSEDRLKFVVNADYIHLIVVKDNGRIIGALTLIENKLLSTYKASIEDVVVDTKYRGQGIGKQLIEYAISIANNSGIEKIDLTSRPGRIAANELYKKLGFELRDTNVYRYNSNK